MVKLESHIVEVKNSNQKVFTFLSNMNNFEKLMPEQVINWNSTETNCSFTIKGMTDLSLSISEKIPYSKIVIIPGDKAPFMFNLICLINENSTNNSTVQIVFQAELSTMMEMLAKNPLQNFVNALASKLKEIGEQL
ncbi:MAG TPA: hypothetical protein PKZ43_09165 [Bacteroidales bacterium]|nr:hypothetical protein [Bacteroidales bacterium]HQH19711.1 hypothetical protein [Bacteroidales bacterium]